jgi:Tfp pilus assembly protein PilF
MSQLDPTMIMGPAEAARLAQHIQAFDFAPGDVILTAGTRAEVLGVVVQGQVAVLEGGGAAGTTRSVLKPGQTFGETMFLEGQPSEVTLQAHDQCEIWLVHRADAQALAAGQRAKARTEAHLEPQPTARLTRQAASGPQPQVETRPESSLRWLRRAGYLAAAIGLLLILALLLPPVRQATALLPMSLGQWCIQEGHDRCAQDAWTVAATLSPDSAAPFLALGMVYLDRGDLVLAEQAFKTAEHLAPNWPEVHNNLGFIYAAREQHDRAARSLRRALELEPGSAAVEYNLALSLQSLGDHAAALEHYQAAQALGASQADLLVNMAIAYYETGQFGKAIQAASEATSAGGDSAPAYAVLGATALKLQEPDAALPILQRAVALDGAYAPAQLYLGLAYEGLEQPTEAREALEQALAATDDQQLRKEIKDHLAALPQMQTGDKEP